MMVDMLRTSADRRSPDVPQRLPFRDERTAAGVQISVIRPSRLDAGMSAGMFVCGERSDLADPIAAIENVYHIMNPMH